MNLHEASRKTWRAKADAATFQEIQTGALQRIATATETMAENYAKLIRERDEAKRTAEYWMADARRMTNKNIALRGVITRLKKERQGLRGRLEIYKDESR